MRELCTTNPMRTGREWQTLVQQVDVGGPMPTSNRAAAAASWCSPEPSCTAAGCDPRRKVACSVSLPRSLTDAKFKASIDFPARNLHVDPGQR